MSPFGKVTCANVDQHSMAKQKVLETNSVRGYLSTEHFSITEEKQEKH